MDRRTSIRFFLSLMGGLVLPIQGWTVTPVASHSRERSLRHLQLRVTFSNPKGYALKGQRLWLYLPVNNVQKQKIISLDVSYEHKLITDDLKHSILELSTIEMPPYSSKIIQINLGIDVSMQAVPEYLTNRDQWLMSEQYIETNDSQIRALASTLKRGSEMDTARAIYDWVKMNLQYSQYTANDFGAVFALKHKQVDCTEYAYLTAALSRANGIPARVVGGYVTDRDTTLRVEDYHNWVEFYFDGAWQLIDAQKENWLRSVKEYIVFKYYTNSISNPIGLAARYRSEGDWLVSFK